MNFYVTGAMMVATVLAEMQSALWSSRTVNVWPWNQYNMPNRFLNSALISNFFLVVALKYAFIMNRCVTTHWYDPVILTIWVTLVYACLEGPHRVMDKETLTRFFANVLHKMSVIIVMLVTLYVLGDLSADDELVIAM